VSVNLRYRYELCLFAVVASLSFCIDIALAQQSKRSRSRQQLSSALEVLIEPSQVATTALLVRDLANGETVFDLNGDLPLKPASVLKLATSATALNQLGADFTWKTEVGIHGLTQGKAQLIAIRGVGDPSLTIESLWMLARRLRKAGVESVESIVLDESAFLDQKQRVGARAYEGGSSALAFNFNSVGLEICPSQAGKSALVTVDPIEAGTVIQGRVITAQKEREALKIEDLSACQESECTLSFKVAGSIAADAVCLQEYRSVERPAEYFGKVLRQLLRQLGVGGAQRIIFRSAPANPNLSFVQASKSLREVLVGLNNFSTNVTAEQLVYAVGNRQGSYSTQWGLERIASYLNSLDIPAGQMQLVDGSGLSHENRLSASAIVRILEHQFQAPESSIEFQGSLSIWGRSGTLKKRRPLPDGIVIRGKTGSLDGVSSLAGYIYRAGRSPLAFAMLQNRVASKAKAVDIEDEVVEYLALKGFS
jgi:serine-type D-Ala-D-Ala carboxypeptidase/endopeptidase (penicillin-binding protein 4)